jgi:hypothetical protein
MHNVCDRIGTELQQSLERIVDNPEIDLAQFVFFNLRYSLQTRIDHLVT